MSDELKLAPCGWGFRHLEVPAYLEECGRLGFRYAEINVSDRPDVRHLSCAPSPGDVSRIAQAEKSTGVKIACFCTGLTFMEPAPEPVREHLEQARTIVDAASDCGAGIVRVFAGFMLFEAVRDEHYERCGAALAELGEYAQPKGVLIALENHGGPATTGAQMRRLLDLADHPNVMANYDGGNFALHGEDPFSAYLVLRGRIGYTHWKGIAAEGGELYPCALGEGLIDWRPVIRGLLADGYNGYWTLELPEGKDLQAQIQRSIRYLRAEATRSQSS